MRYFLRQRIGTFCAQHIRGLKFIFIFLIGLVCGKNVMGQPTVLGTQAVNGTYTTYDLNTIGSFKQYRLQATSSAASGARNWEFATGTAGSTNYSTNWRPYTAGQTLTAYNTYIDPATQTASARYNTSFGGSSGLLPAVTSGNYYTFNVSNNSATDNYMAVLETSFSPTTFSSASQYPSTSLVTSSSGVTVTVSMSSTPNASENVFIRYSTDNFSTSTIVAVVLSGSSGRATIPAFTAGTTVKYYFFSSPSAASTPSSATADMLTLNLLNNSGSNYSYTVGAAFSQYERNSFSGTYSAITTGGGATQINGGTATTDFSTTGGTSNTDDGAALIALPFNFNFAGNSYTTSNFVNVCTNGYVSFVATSSNANKVIQSVNTFMYSTTTPNEEIAGWWDDLTIGSGSVLYQTQGSSPNRTFTIQFTNVNTYFTTSTSTINFQIILYETSNVVELRYSTATNANHSGSESASIGLEWGSGGSGNFLDAATGSKTIGNSMLNSENFPQLFYRFFQISSSPTPLSAGTYSVGSGQTYTTLSDAFADLNHRGISGAITLNCTDASYSLSTGNLFPMVLGVVSGVSASNTITVQGNNATISHFGGFSGDLLTPGSSTAITTSSTNSVIPLIAIAGTDYVTFKSFTLSYSGSTPNNSGLIGRSISIVNSSATDGATNNTLRDLTISLTRTNTASFAILQDAATTPTSSLGANSTNKYYNLSISNVYSGIKLNGNSTFFDASCEIGIISGGTTTIGSSTSNDIGNGTGAVYGIWALNQNAVKIFSTTVRNLTCTSSPSISGILLDYTSGASTISAGTNEIYLNTVYNLNNTNTSAGVISGIDVSLTSNAASIARVYNNFVYGLNSSSTTTASRRIIGIRVQVIGNGSGGTHNIDFNSVTINHSNLSTTSACFQIGTTSGPTINVRNNIFSNTTAAQSGGAKHYCVTSTATNTIGTGTWDRNIYYVTNSNGFTGLTNATDRTLLSDWKTAVTQDANSFNTDPQFISSTNLHINTSASSDAESGGSYFSSAITWVSQDIDAETRSTSTPDIGADEFDGCSTNYYKWLGGTSTDWNTGSNWCSGTVPDATKNVVIPSGTTYSPLISLANATCASVTINSGATLTMSSTYNLTISSAGSFTNNGTFTATASTGAVVFSGTGTITGSSATTFTNITINGNLTVSTVPTINGNFQINVGTVSAAPNYGTSSYLIYNTGATTSAGSEWATGVSSGTGVPQNVTIGNGSNTTLNFGATTSYRQALGNISISASSGLTLSSASGGDLQVGGDFANNGTFTNNSRNVTFNGSANATISGGSISFYTISINKGSSTATTLDVNSAITLTAVATTTITNGLVRINSSGSISKSAAAGWTISNVSTTTAGLHVNGGSFSQLGASVTVNGLFRITSGSASIGTVSGNSLSLQTGSTFDMQGGSLTIAGRFENTTATGAATISVSGGTMTLCTVANTSTITGSFHVNANSALTISGSPTIIFQNPSTAATTPTDLYLLSGAGAKSITGGTFQFGNTSTSASQTFRINSAIAIYNTILNSTNNPTVQLDLSLQVNGTLNFGGTNALNINGKTLTLSGPITNGSGTFTGSTTSNLTINGSGTISGNLSFTTGSQQLGIITVNRSGVPVTIATDLTLNADGSTISSGSTLNNLSGKTFALGSGSLAGIAINGTFNIAGILQMNTGGYVTTGSAPAPTYASTSTLIYNSTAATYNVGNEWTGNSTTAGLGVPQNVTIQNTNNVTMPGGSRGLAGNLNINAGTLSLNTTTGNDLYIGGNWYRASGAVFTPNYRAVYFNGNSGADQTITAASGTETFAYLGINKTDTKNVQLNSTNIIVNGGLGGNAFQLLNGGIDLNQKTFTFTTYYNGNLNAMSIDGTLGNLTRLITSTGGTGTFAFTHSDNTLDRIAIISRNSALASLLSFSSNVLVTIGSTGTKYSGINFGNSYSTINGTLRIDAGGYVDTYPPYYATGSLLKYNSGGNYYRFNEWNNTVGNPGYPYNVQVSTTGTKVIPAGTANAYTNTALDMAGSLTIDAGCTYDMSNSGANNMTSSLNVLGNITINGSLISSGTSSSDIKLAGHWINNGTFSANNRTVWFNGSSLQNITGTTVFDNLNIDNSSANGVQIISGTTVYVTTSNTSTGSFGLKLLNTGPFDLYGNTCVIGNGNGNNINGSIQVENGVRNIISSAGIGRLSITGSIASPTSSVLSVGGGTLNFSSSVIVNLTNGFDFGSNLTTINGTLQMNTNSFISNNPPFYGTGSYLEYISGQTPFLRSLEWSTSTGAGYPYNVQIYNFTTVSAPTSTNTSIPLNLAGSLNIISGSLYMTYGSNNMTVPLIVNGDITNGGILSESVSSGGDIELKGNWYNNGGFIPNNRNVTFNGTSAQLIGGANSTSFDNLTVSNSSSYVTMGNNVTVNSTCALNSTLSISSYTLTLAGTITGSGYLSGTTSSNLTMTGTGQVGTLRFATGGQLLNTLSINRTGITNNYAALLGSNLTVNALTLTSGIIATDNNLLTWTKTGALSAPAIPYLSNNTTYKDSYICLCTFAGLSLTLTTPYDGSVGFKVNNVGTDTWFPIGVDFKSPNRMWINNTGTTDDITVAIKKGDIGGTDKPVVERIWYVKEGTTGGTTAEMRLYFTKQDPLLYPGSQDEVESNFIYTDMHLAQKDYNDPNYIDVAQYGDVLNGSTNTLGTELFGQYTFGTSPDILNNTDGINQFSRFTVLNINTIILPVTLVNMQAYQTGNHVNVLWTSLTETNMDRYVVERSTNGVTFTALGTVAAKGNGLQRTDYSFTDMLPNNGDNFYRIKAFDKTGHIIYTPVVLVHIGNNITGVLIYPNPVSGKKATLQFNNMDAGDYAVTIYDNTGKRVYGRQIEHLAGSASYILYMPVYIVKGIYHVQIENKLFKTTKEILIE